MKKLIPYCMSAILAFVIVTPVSAEDSYITNNGTAQSSITYTVDSHYTIIIPETIDASSGEITLQASDMNISDNLQVNVYCTNLADNNTILLSNEAGNTIDFTFSGMRGTNCVATFKGQNTSSEFSVTPMVSNAESAKPGNYTGTAEFMVQLLPLGAY